MCFITLEFSCTPTMSTPIVLCHHTRYFLYTFDFTWCTLIAFVINCQVIIYLHQRLPTWSWLCWQLLIQWAQLKQISLFSLIFFRFYDFLSDHFFENFIMPTSNFKHLPFLLHRVIRKKDIWPYNIWLHYKSHALLLVPFLNLKTITTMCT